VCLKKERSLNLCFFSHSAELFGAERSLLDLTARMTAKFGALCTVVLPHEGPLQAQLEERGVATRIINYHWWCADRGASPDPEKFDHMLGESLYKIVDNVDDIQKLSPDIILTSTMVIPWGAAVAEMIKRPHIWWIKEFGELDHNFEFSLPFQQTLDIIRETSNYMVFNSEIVKETLFKGISPDKGRVAYNLKPVFSETSQPQKTYFKDTLSIKLLISGRVAKSKGQDDAIYAVEILLERGYNIELCILGDSGNPFGNSLREYVRSRKMEDWIHFENFCENVRPVIEQSDIGLTCSINEAFGRATAESMALGRPVIGTRSGGTAELIEDGIDGLLYSPGEVAQLAEKITFFADAPEKIMEFGARAAQNIERKLSGNPADDTFYQLCRELKGRGNSGSSQLNRRMLEWQKKHVQKLLRDLEEIKSSKKWAFASSLGNIRAAIAPTDSPQFKILSKAFIWIMRLIHKAS